MKTTMIIVRVTDTTTGDCGLAALTAVPARPLPHFTLEEQPKFKWVPTLAIKARRTVVNGRFVHAELVSHERCERAPITRLSLWSDPVEELVGLHCGVVDDFLVDHGPGGKHRDRLADASTANTGPIGIDNNFEIEVAGIFAVTPEWLEPTLLLPDAERKAAIATLDATALGLFPFEDVL